MATWPILGPGSLWLLTWVWTFRPLRLHLGTPTGIPSGWGPTAELRLLAFRQSEHAVSTACTQCLALEELGQHRSDKAAEEASLVIDTQRSIPFDATFAKRAGGCRWSQKGASTYCKRANIYRAVA